MDLAIHTLINGLNEDLANEYSAIITCNYNAAFGSSLSRQEVQAFFTKEMQQAVTRAAYLAEHIAMLGGIPTVKLASIQPVESIKEMLHVAACTKARAIERYKKRLKQAEEAGEIVLKIKLEDIITDEMCRKQELERL